MVLNWLDPIVEWLISTMSLTLLEVINIFSYYIKIIYVVTICLFSYYIFSYYIRTIFFFFRS